MLRILLLFLYMGLTSWILGYGVLSLLTARGMLGILAFGRGIRGEGTVLSYRVRHRLSYLLVGVVVSTVYAQVWSLFAPVGRTAQIVFFLLCAAILCARRRQILQRLLYRVGYVAPKRVRRSLPDGYLLSGRIWLLYVGLLLWIAYGTSHGIMHYDTGLYHAQSIRFLEEYGTVRGLANLHGRLGYNSASFAYSALYSFAFLGRQSYHAGAGYFALLLSFACLDLKHILRRGRPVLTDCIRFAGLYYLFNIYKEIVSPAPDYFLNCFLFCLLILWVDLDVHHERHFLPYALLSVGVVYAVTLKLSAVGLLLLAVKPIVMIARDAARRTKRKDHGFRGVPKKRNVRHALAVIGCFVALSLAVALPYLVRNVLLSGWPLFPSTVPPFPAVAWQVPRDVAQGEANGIRAWARGVVPAADGAYPLEVWFMPWFRAQSGVSRIVVTADLFALLGFAIYVLAVLLRLWRAWHKRKQRRGLRVVKRFAPILRMSRSYLLYSKDFVFLEAVCLAAFLFWFLQAPLMRYGFFFAWVPPALIAGRLLLLLLGRETDRRARRFTNGLACMIVVFLLYKCVRMAGADLALTQPRYLLAQQDYESFVVAPYVVDGCTFYAPTEGDRTGYYGFPGGDHRASVRLLGQGLADGLAAP